MPQLTAPTTVSVSLTKLVWSYPANVSGLAGFRLIVPPQGNAARRTLDVGKEVRQYQTDNLQLAPGTYYLQIKAIGVNTADNSAPSNFGPLVVPEATPTLQVCADYSVPAEPTAAWTVMNLGVSDQVRISLDGTEIMQGGPLSESGPLPTISAGSHTLQVQAINANGTLGASAEVTFAPTTETRQCGTKKTGVFTCDNANNRVLDPNGDPIKLCGYRVEYGASSTDNKGAVPMTTARIEATIADGLMGTNQGIEVWWARTFAQGPGDPDPKQWNPNNPKENYNTQNLGLLKERIKALGERGVYSTISVRVSYTYGTKNGDKVDGSFKYDGQTGWAEHNRLVRNEFVNPTQEKDANGNPIYPNKDRNLGRHRERFFAWLDWFIPALLKDEDGSDSGVGQYISYWEMWHYYGHLHSVNATRDQYLDEFIPAMIAKFREHEPDRMLGVGFVADTVVERVIERLEAHTNGSGLKPWKPYNDHNLCYIVAGYGLLGKLMRRDEETGADAAPTKDWPEDSNNPDWLGAPHNKHNIVRLMDLVNTLYAAGKIDRQITYVEQEGPGLVNWWRRSPIPAQQRKWLIGLLNLWNEHANGFALHRWPPDWEGYGTQGTIPPSATNPTPQPIYDADHRYTIPKPGMPGGGIYNQSDFHNIMRLALAGKQVHPTAYPAAEA